MIAHIAVLQDQLASANKTGEVANALAEEMNNSPTQLKPAGQCEASEIP